MMLKEKRLSKLNIRPVDEKDVPALAVLAEEFMPGEASMEERISVLKEALKNPDYVLLVAELNGETAGFIDQWIIYDFAHDAKLSFIQNLYVASKHRRKGIGNNLLQKIIESAKKNDVAEIHVVTEFENQAAIKLYKKQGLVKESLQLEMEFK